MTSASVFTSVGGELAYAGSAAWYAGSVPSGSTQVTVMTSKGAQTVGIGWASA